MKFHFDVTGIGSVPFKDPEEACRVIVRNFHHIPFWPQLPKRSFLENMYVQYAESLPGVVIDQQARTIHIETSKVAEGIESVYQKFIDNDTDFFKISPDHARGLYEFSDQVKHLDKMPSYVKGHVTGPVSFALSVTDQNKKSIIYDKDLFEVLTKILLMRTKWQIRKLKKLCPNVIIFIDEPYLVSVGSSYVNINVSEAFGRIDEVVAAIREEGALSGIHCCGNTDWPLLLSSDIDILNFDAYNFVKEFLLYSNDIAKFLKKGGTIAWGIAPSSEACEKENEVTLGVRIKDALDSLKAKGVDLSEVSSMLTPSCGLGTLDEDRAKRIFEMLRHVPAKIHRR